MQDYCNSSALAMELPVLQEALIILSDGNTNHLVFTQNCVYLIKPTYVIHVLHVEKVKIIKRYIQKINTL